MNSIRYASIILTLICLIPPIYADWNEEKAKIDYLIERVGQVEGVFVRNGKEHAPADAVDHLRYKLKRGMNSWFAPDKEEWTVEMFIEKIATKSSLSGRVYQIKLTDGTVVNSAEWMKARLVEYPISLEP